MYISANSFAVMQLDFEYAPDKTSDNFQILGIGHSTDFIKARVIFEKGETNYYPKYINAQRNESVSIDRNLSLMRKQKRFLTDKELNEVKLKLEISIQARDNLELLVIDRAPIDSLEFKNAKQPEDMKFKKEYVFSPEAWKENTIIAPSSELLKYKRE